jgi:hypothetical protein
MATQDSCCTIVPYFRIKDGQLDAFKTIAEQCVTRTHQESGCLFYGFSFNGNEAHCREGYQDGAAALAHLENIGPLLEQLLGVAELHRLEVHGSEAELAKLREPMASFKPQFFTLEYGFRR